MTSRKNHFLTTVLLAFLISCTQQSKEEKFLNNIKKETEEVSREVEEGIEDSKEEIRKEHKKQKRKKKLKELFN